MRKQAGPSQISTNQPENYAGYYSSNQSQGRDPVPAQGIYNSGHQGQQPPQYARQPPAMNQPLYTTVGGGQTSPPKEASAAVAAKVPVEAETVYPKPHKLDSLLSVFFTDPGKFEGISLFDLEFVFSKIEHLVNKRVHERMVPFKVEMGNMIESLGKANLTEVSELSHSLKDLETSIKQQDKVVTSLCDKYQVITSQIQLLESAGVKHNSEEEQLSNIQKIRENLKAETTLIVNERLKDELTQLEDRVNKKLEETDKKTASITKKVDANKTEADEQAKQYQELSAKLEDIGKLVAELTVTKPKETQEQMGRRI